MSEDSGTESDELKKAEDDTDSEVLMEEGENDEENESESSSTASPVPRRRGRPPLKRKRGRQSKTESRKRREAAKAERLRAKKIKVTNRKRIVENNRYMKGISETFNLTRATFFLENKEILQPFMKPTDFKRLTVHRAKPKPLGQGDKLVTHPSYIVGGTLRDYQLEGIQWLLNKRRAGVCPILGDEMGLGKTLQTITFLAHLKFTAAKSCGPSLVVCPLSVIQSWCNEFKRWCPDLRVIRMHSSDRSEREILKGKMQVVQDYDVCVTTYEMLISETHTMCSMIFWHYVILDEGHRIKNAESKLSKAANKIRRVASIVLTGTPLQNNIKELWAVMKFLCPGAFRDSELFERCFRPQEEAEGEGKNNAMDRSMLEKAHVLLHSFMLRRLKKEVTELPPKIETNIMVSLSALQRHLYKKILLHGTPLLLESESEQVKKQSAKFKRVAQLIMELRKCCNHPYMFNGVQPEDVDPEMDTGLVTSSGKMMVMERLLMKLKTRGHKVLIFSQFKVMLNLLEQFLSVRKWKYLRLDGNTNRVLRAVNIREFNSEKSGYSIFILQTRAGGLGINLQSADTVILYDSDWNPQPDLQAMARCHRIGQKRVVHVYRFVTSGSIEERVLSTQQKKLYMDKILTRDSTATAKELNEIKKEEERKEMLAALKFGANAVFKPAKEVSDEDLDNIIDRTRGLDDVDQDGVSDKISGSGTGSGSVSGSMEGKSMGRIERVDTNASNFDCFKELVSTYKFEGDLYNAEGISSLAKKWKQQQNEKAAQADKENEQIKGKKQSEAIPGGEGTAEVAGSKAKADSSGDNNWKTEVKGEGGSTSAKIGGGGNGVDKTGGSTGTSKQDGTGTGTGVNTGVITTRRSNRKRKHRVIMVGGVPMLASDLFIMDDNNAPKTGVNPYSVRRKLPGRDYPNSTVCGNCWAGGSLICCDLCPAAYHVSCLGMEEDDPALDKKWYCPLHSCCVCGKKAKAVGGALFGCRLCPLAYCDEHLHEDAKIVYKNPVFDALRQEGGSQSMIPVECSRECIAWGMENKSVVDAVIEDHRKELENFLKKKRKVEKAKVKAKERKIDVSEIWSSDEDDDDQHSSSSQEWRPDNAQTPRDKARRQRERKEVERLKRYTEPSSNSSQVKIHICHKCKQPFTGVLCANCGESLTGATEHEIYLSLWKKWILQHVKYLSDLRTHFESYSKLAQPGKLMAGDAEFAYNYKNLTQYFSSTRTNVASVSQAVQQLSNSIALQAKVESESSSSKNPNDAAEGKQDQDVNEGVGAGEGTGDDAGASAGAGAGAAAGTGAAAAAAAGAGEDKVDGESTGLGANGEKRSSEDAFKEARKTIEKLQISTQDSVRQLQSTLHAMTRNIRKKQAQVVENERRRVQIEYERRRRQDEERRRQQERIRREEENRKRVLYHMQQVRSMEYLQRLKSQQMLNARTGVMGHLQKTLATPLSTAQPVGTVQPASVAGFSRATPIVLDADPNSPNDKNSNDKKSVATAQPAAPSAVSTVAAAPATGNVVVDWGALRRKYAVELVQLKDLGFGDEEASLNALQKTDGDLRKAYKLLSSDRGDAR